MTEHKAPPESLLLLGRDVTIYGDIRMCRSAEGRVALALSVGATPGTPADAFKGRRHEPNEDAAYARVEATRAMLAVADAHHGAHASHALLEAMAQHDGAVPASPHGLLDMLQSLPYARDDELPQSATSLLAVVHRYDMNAGFGFCFGDATCTLVGENHAARALHRNTPGFVFPGESRTLAGTSGSFFEYDAAPGHLLVAFTDGVNECCYRKASRSPQAHHRAALFHDTGPDAEGYARALAELSLDGLPGEPGGQDNLAIAALKV